MARYKITLSLAQESILSNLSQLYESHLPSPEIGLGEGLWPVLANKISELFLERFPSLKKETQLKKEFFSACDSWNHCSHLVAGLRMRANIQGGQTQKMCRLRPVILQLEPALAVDSL